MVIAGPSLRYTHETRANIPAQWARFAPQIGKIPGQVGGVSYGVCWNFEANGDFDYLSGVEVSNTTGLPPGFAHVVLPSTRYAVFTHDEHVSSIPQTIEYVWGTWAPNSGVRTAKGPVYERYGDGFNPQMGLGDIEFWVPIAE